MSISLESLTIRGFRGIRNEEQFEFGRRNTVVTGPNGTGKSTILQAVEFLLTGQIAALRGSGTGGIRVSEHIPNQYANPDDTAVRARFTTGDGESFRVVREFSNRSRLQAGDRPEEFRELVTSAEQGLLHLTRDELLELVIATPGNRKDQIYHLMNTEGLDRRRKQLKRLKRKAEDEVSTRTTRYEENLRQLVDIVGDEIVTDISDETELRPVVLQEAVNERRDRLGGQPIESLDAVDSFSSGLTSPLDQASNPLQRDDTQRHISRLSTWFDRGETNVAEALDDLREEIRALRADEDALDAVMEHSLVQQGRSIIDADTRACPLCKEPWDPDDLESHLERRAEKLTRIEERIGTIDELATTASGELETIRTTIERLLDTFADGDIGVDLHPLAAYRNELDTVIETLAEDPAQHPSRVSLDALGLSATNPTDAVDTLDTLRQKADALPDQSTIEATWTELESLDDAYRALQTAAVERKQYERAAIELETAHETFLAVRDDVLGETFDSISDRFADFYEKVNPDESAFDPTLGQTNTGVEFSVEFYDTGEHPPNALHSEGHQDLMGVCLFLALASELSPLEIAPVLLDDVVMSVDREHRDQFASVLRDTLSDHFQLLITTHDPTWARQLVETDVVRNGDVIQFTEWSPELGPVVQRGFK